MIRKEKSKNGCLSLISLIYHNLEIVCKNLKQQSVVVVGYTAKRINDIHIRTEAQKNGPAANELQKKNELYRNTL